MMYGFVFLSVLLTDKNTFREFFMMLTSVTTGADDPGRTVRAVRGVKGIFSFGAGRCGEYGVPRTVPCSENSVPL